MTLVEKKIFDESVKLFEELLDDFKSKDLLRKGIPHSDREKLVAILKNSRQIGNAFNVVFSIFDSKEKIDSVIEKCTEEGITDNVLTYTFLSQLFGVAMLNFESVFKTSLLFFLKEKSGFHRRMTLGQLIKNIKKVSTLGQKIEDKIDYELRNSLAHGTFWFGEGKVFLVENSYLEGVQEIPLHKFFVRVKDQNIVAHAFIQALIGKTEQGYFRE